MKARYFVTLSAIALTTGLLQLAAQVQQIPGNVVYQEGNISRRLFLSPYTSPQTPTSNPSAILFLARDRTFLVSQDKDSPPPRPSIPGGSRLRQDLRIRPLCVFKLYWLR
ncbi:MAG TPA: hypothetical protein V6C95_05380 [Coleofasciculaceae cyanobacterium]